MKICPRCQKTYTDDNLNFCLDDGVVLQQQTPAGNEPPETVFMNQPPATNPNPVMTSQPSVQQPPPPAWNTAPQQYGGGQPKKKSSKAWIWALLVLALVVVVCGSGSVAALYFIGRSAENNVAANTTANSKNSSNSRSITTNSASNSTSTLVSNTSTSNASPDGRETAQDIELSDLVIENSLYGNTAFSNDEFTMSSKKPDFYYVIVAKGMGYTTDDGDTKVTLSNRDGGPSTLGYGLVFHSNPTPLMQDYAFLIDTKKKRYRVVHHTPGDEGVVVAWTNSNLIHDGSQENTLEVRDRASDKKVELYINGQLVNTVPNTFGYTNGVPGLYTGGTTPIVFKQLEILKK
jgi:hypothetical protein